MNVDEAYKVLVAIRDNMIDINYENHKDYDAWLEEGKAYLVQIFIDQIGGLVE